MPPYFQSEEGITYILIFRDQEKKGRNVLSRIPFECITGAHKKPYIQTQSQKHIYNALENEDRI